MLNWESLQTACLSCTSCPLSQTRHNVVFGVGPQDAEVMVRRRGAGRKRRPAGRAVCRRGREISRRNALDHRSGPGKLLYHEHRQVPSAQKPRPDADRAGCVHRLSACGRRSSSSRRSSSALAASRPCASSVRISRSPANTDSSPKRAASSSPRSITPPPSCATKPSARTPFQISRPSNPKSARSAQEPYNRQGTRRRACPSCFAARERPRLPLGKLAAERSGADR